ncbi:hypothetical protein [Asanoa siamensis]|uniref:Uncharacterized protein n=1 Tax=Asanoa siamensis TaxID=926357 RepID=A0ABQ4CI26_9ACTN|nr:hypothetical protein [Asanoa siamensis]GIF70956.1 hypothetical protein Asi02nite_04740 [Asanoa siamensis]
MSDPEEVARSLGGAYWSVDEGRWETLAPALPHDCVDLLAPPILVGAAPCGVDAVAALPALVAPRRGTDPTALDRLDMLVPATV